MYLFLLRDLESKLFIHMMQFTSFIGIEISFVYLHKLTMLSKTVNKILSLCEMVYSHIKC